MTSIQRSTITNGCALQDAPLPPPSSMYLMWIDQMATFRISAHVYDIFPFLLLIGVTWTAFENSLYKKSFLILLENDIEWAQKYVL